MELIASFLPIILMGVVFYFLLIRPQQKQVKEKQNMLKQMKPGDTVVTIGGLHGVVDELSQSSNTVVLDCEGVYLTFALSAIASVKEGGNIVERQEEIVEANEEALEDFQGEQE
ncbi:preprotein translocase subunit YajC [Aerococcaceae bacterium DSM 111176]|nr:preprotein translocase subunit YajC [Aerococcaceae bacterium DSM 111176]